MSIEIILFHLFESACGAFTLAYYFKAFLGKRFESGAIYFLAYALITIVNVMFVMLSVNVWHRGVINMSFPFIVALLMYSGTIWKRTFTAGLNVAFHIITEPFAVSIVSWATGHIFLEMPEENTLYFVTAGISTLLYMLSVIIIVYRRKKRAVAITAKQYAVLSLLIAICVFMAYTDLKVILQSGVEISLTHIFVIFCICAMPVLIFFVFERFQEYAYEHTLTRVLQAQLEQNEKQFELLETHQIEIRKLRHDILGQLTIMREMAKRNKDTELMDYLEHFSADVSPVLDNVITGLSGVDALIAYKRKIAAENDIHFEIRIPAQSEIKINPVHLNNILMNALDNAIEACLALNNTCKRYIELELRTQDEYLFIKVANSSQPVIFDDGNFPLSSKEDKSAHGVGLESIKQSVGQHNGIMSIEYRDGEFRLLIRMGNCD